MLFLPAAISSPFLIANIFSAIKDKVQESLDGILTNVIQGVAGTLYDALTSGIETLTNRPPPECLAATGFTAGRITTGLHAAAPRVERMNVLLF